MIPSIFRQNRLLADRMMTAVRATRSTLEAQNAAKAALENAVSNPTAPTGDSPEEVRNAWHVYRRQQALRDSTVVPGRQILGPGEQFIQPGGKTVTTVPDDTVATVERKVENITFAPQTPEVSSMQVWDEVTFHETRKGGAAGEVVESTATVYGDDGEVKDVIDLKDMSEKMDSAGLSERERNEVKKELVAEVTQKETNMVPWLVAGGIGLLLLGGAG